MAMRGITVTRAAAQLGLDRAALFAFLREKGWLPPKGSNQGGSGKGNMPTAAALYDGRMDTSEYVFRHSDGRPGRSITPLITEYGLMRLRAELPAPDGNGPDTPSPEKRVA